MSRTPLSGILVVDLSRYLPGPLAAKLLADLGARVLKVEEPVLGDPVRQAPPFRDGQGELAAMMLAGIESISLDLSRERARTVLERILERADVLLESFRPGTLRRFGLDPGQLAVRYPRLVICSLSGWGQDGPYAGRTGHDLTYQAIAGALITARMPGAPTADLVGAWSSCSAVLAALLERERTGRGSRVDTSLVDGACHANLVSWAEEAGGVQKPGEDGLLSGALPCYNLYRTLDGKWIALAALERRFWRRFCSAVGRRDLVKVQLQRNEESRRRVAALIGSRSRDYWVRLFAEQDLPGAPVLAPGEAMEDPQMKARGMLVREEDGSLRLGFPALLDGHRPAADGRSPAAGEDTLKILEEFATDVGKWSRRERRAAGIGPRVTLRRLLWHLVTRSNVWMRPRSSR